MSRIQPGTTVYTFADGTRHLERYRVNGPSTNWGWEYARDWKAAKAIMMAADTVEEGVKGSGNHDTDPGLI